MELWSFFNIPEISISMAARFFTPYNMSRVINNDGGTAGPLIDGSVLCNAICFELNAVVL